MSYPDEACGVCGICIAASAKHTTPTMSTVDIDKQLDELLIWDIGGHKEPAIFATPMKLAIKKLLATQKDTFKAELLAKMPKKIVCKDCGVELSASDGHLRFGDDFECPKTGNLTGDATEYVKNATITDFTKIVNEL